MDKPDLLLLHGALGASTQFAALVPLLEEHFEIYTLDFSGHGDAPPANDFGIITFANEVLYELSKWDMDRINIFGYSMGGYVATYLSLKTDRVMKAFTLGTKFLWTAEYAAQETKKLNPAKILEKVPAYAMELQARHKHIEWETILGNTSAMMTEMGQSNLLDINALSHVSVPICIGVGDSDNTVGVNETLAVSQAMPQAKMCVLPNTPHPFEKVNPALLAEAIKQYFLF